ncbi:MAG: zinc ribbon domain-containing protein, partial [Microcoleus sp.]
SKESIGVDPGMVYKLSTSRGYRKPENKRADHQRWRYEQNLQAALDHKLDHNALLWLRHPSRTKDDVAKIIPLSEASWQKLKDSKTLEEIVGAIGNYRFQIIKHRLPESNKQKAIKAKIKAHKSKDKARRKSWDDAWTTLTARKFGYIAIENGLQVERNRHRPEPVSNDGGKTFEPNGAKRKARFNLRLSEAAPGQTIALLARKAKRYGREFEEIPAMGTTINCPVCGTDNEATIKMDDDKNRLYKCECCGWEEDRDIHAGVNIELAGFGNNPDVELSPLAKKARTLSCKWQEANPKAPKPLWVNGFKDAAEKYGRDAYSEGISDGFDGKKKGKGKQAG